MSQRKKKRTARRVPRLNRIETLESRIVMSADPLLGPLLGHHAINDAPSLNHHDAGFGGGLGHAIVESAPVYDAGADFWINSDILFDDDDLGEEIDQTLYDAHGLTGQDDMVSKYGFNGAGQTVVVIDSGIAYNHYALGGGLGSDYRVVGGWDFTEGDADPYDDGPQGAHGTHVAGVIGAQGDGQHSGVATGVDLVGLRVFDDAGNGYFSWVEQALAWVHTNKDSFENSITAVNLSLGTDWNSASVPSWAMLEDEFAALEADGIFISVSAGNSFTSYNVQGLSYPAASSHVIPVMSVDNDGSLSYFSQRAENAIAAPGRWITSTVPDYAANDADSIDDDWLSMSGTSMAAPYMAGASVLVRQAMEFVGQTGIDQWDIYDHMMATADSFYDSATSATYKRLNLEAAIDALMPIDDYGSTIETAYDLGTLNDTSGSTPLSLMTGAITTLSDADYFTFTAGATGTVTFNTTSASHDMTSEWAGWGGSWTVGADGYSIDVVAGQDYSVALSSSDGLGYYDLDISLESSFAFIDLGAISTQETHAGLAVSGEQWYGFTAGQSGYFTVESLPQSGTAQVDLYDANQNLLANDIGSGRADAIVASGDTIYVRVTGDSADLDLRLTNAVAISGASVTLTGTSGDDAIEFHASTTSHTASLNGVWYSFDAATETTFAINGGGGTDTATLHGTAGDEVAQVHVNSTTLTGQGFSVAVVGASNVYLNSEGGYDQVSFYDTAGDDYYIGWSDRASMRGDGFRHDAIGYSNAVAHTSGGYDRATFYDTAASEWYIGYQDRVRFGGSGFHHDARSFDSTLAFSTGGQDTATFYDTAGDDVYVAWSDRAIMAGDGYHNDTRGFSATNAYSTSGNDLAKFYDSSEDDSYIAWSDRAIVTGEGYYNDSRGFGQTVVYGSTGNDTAIFYDTSGDDSFIGRSDRGTMLGSGYQNDAYDFDNYTAYSTSGYDQATFYDSAGDDKFVGYQNRSKMWGSGFFHEVSSFDKTVAFASSGNDEATFFDSAGNDSYVAWSDRALMAGNGFFNDVRGFDKTVAFSSGGTDTAKFYDSTGVDKYVSWSDRAFMTGVGYFNDAHDFGTTNAFSTVGLDTAIFYDSTGDDLFQSNAILASLSGSGFYNSAAGFSRVEGHATLGTDTAVLYDTVNDDDVSAEAWGAYLSSTDFYSEARGFDSVTAHSDLGGNDVASVASALDYAFATEGGWA